tara:strand:- start:63 stop:287 length:225 start_codon:yes stop_codon:yes gene_type:complete
MGYLFADVADRAIVKCYGAYTTHELACNALEEIAGELTPTGYSRSCKSNKGVYWVKQLVINSNDVVEINIPDPL